MIKNLLVASLFSLSLVFSTAWAQVSIINDQHYTSNDGTLHIVGEIENNSSVPLNQVIVTATVYSKDGKILGSTSTNSILETIMPEKKGPFDLLFHGISSEVNNYLLDLKYKPADAKTESLEIPSSYARLDPLDNFIISGKVVNHDQKTANTIVVIATFYDIEGKVIATGKTHTEPEYLIAGGEAPFLLAVSDKSQSSLIQDYSLMVESEEYTAVPEFPLSTGLMLAFSVVGYIIFTRPKILTVNLFDANNSG